MNGVTQAGIEEERADETDEGEGVAKDQTTTKWQIVVGVPYAPSTR